MIYLKVGRPRDDDAMRRGGARGDRAGDAAADRPERGVGCGDRGRADPPARGARPRLGGAARSALGRRRARARPAEGRREDRGRPGRLHDAAAPEVLEADAADVIVQGPPRRGRPAPFRRQAHMCEAWGLPVNLHAFMQSEISFLAHAQVASTVPNLTRGEPDDAPAARGAADDRRRRLDTPNGKYALNDGAGARLRDRRGRRRPCARALAARRRRTTRSSRSALSDDRRRRRDHGRVHAVRARARRRGCAAARGGNASRIRSGDGQVGGDRAHALLEPGGRADGRALARRR